MNKREELKELCISGLFTDGAHHKQWYLEEILKLLGFDLNKIRDELNTKDYYWDEAIAP